ncbi:MAG: WbqC family protein [Cyclobacteriaceae bacterium]
MNQPLLIELQYLPCLEYFAALNKHKVVVMEKHEHYGKQSYRNRCRILTANKVMSLSIPVKKNHSSKVIADVEIDYSQKWLSQHWNTISSAYGNAPYFEYFSEYFYKILFKKNRFLFDLNLELLSIILDLLQWPKDLKTTEVYHPSPASGYEDLRDMIHPKRSYKKNNLYEPCNYNQVFGKNFVRNLSIIDLLFCQGLEAKQVIKQSTFGSHGNNC